tara:strand:+ start:3435 stop:4649 length:1215 start_codon:yes stop_codon:yes gene_type:complete
MVYIKKGGTGESEFRHNTQNTRGVMGLNGVYTGIVVDNKDSIYTGRIQVRIGQFGSNPDTKTTYWALLMVPFGGVQDPKSSGKNVEDESQSTKSYGMWPQPPEIGTEVVVAFNDSRNEGILMGSLISKDRNHMMGGNASSTTKDDGKLGPVVEKNIYDNNDEDRKPVNTAQNNILVEQGLAKDLVRGHSASSARRESPSKVFGITTKDGHVLSMDDGFNNGLSKNIRLRTSAGAQILLDDTANIIFINNHKANAWIELSPDGKIDFYSDSSVSVHARKDFNIHADGNINMQADMGVNIKAMGASGIKMETATGPLDIKAADSIRLHTLSTFNILASSNYKLQAPRVDMNSPSFPPDPAQIVTVNKLQPNNTGIIESAASRVPEKHPWKGATEVPVFVNAEGIKK